MDEEHFDLLKRIAVALEKIAINTTPEKDEDLRARIRGFDAGFNPGGK